MRTLSLSALNIVLPPPHAASRYEELWVEAFRHQQPVRLRGDVGGLVRNVIRSRAKEAIFGDLLKFVNIAESRWLDLTTKERVKQDEVDERVSIPDSFRPNLHSVFYIFFPKVHRLVFATRVDQNNTLSPLMAQALVSKYLNCPQNIAKYGEVKVTIEPDRETLERIFKLKKLKQIELEIRPPNALGDVERELMEFLEQQNASVYRQELVSDDPAGLQLSEHTQLAAKVAQSNGYVAAKGENERGRVEELSTRSHPYQNKVTYESNVHLAQDVFEEAANTVIHDVTRPISKRK
nr:DUF4747 family protein [uncultured Duganella sp.]